MASGWEDLGGIGRAVLTQIAPLAEGKSADFWAYSPFRLHLQMANSE